MKMQLVCAKDNPLLGSHKLSVHTTKAHGGVSNLCVSHALKDNVCFRFKYYQMTNHACPMLFEYYSMIFVCHGELMNQCWKLIHEEV